MIGAPLKQKNKLYSYDYSQTCSKRSQETGVNSYAIFYDSTRGPFNACDCLVEVTAWTV